MHPHHDGKKFIVPRRDEAPEVGVVAETFTERLEDEMAELVQARVQHTPLMAQDQIMLERFGADVLAMIRRRSEADIEDFSKPVPKARATITPEQRRKIEAAALGRILDFVCKGRRVLDMGPRIFAVASHVRRSAIDYRTDQEAANETGNGSRNSVNKIKSDLRRLLGADYPGENGKGSNTKAKCKTARLTQLRN